jgi:hypothetical protein
MTTWIDDCMDDPCTRILVIQLSSLHCSTLASHDYSIYVNNDYLAISELIIR